MDLQQNTQTFVTWLAVLNAKNIQHTVKGNCKVVTVNKYREIEVELHSLLALDGGEWSASRPSHFIPENEPRYSSPG